uniref:Uncharacterized protein n=1 Tax=Timema poppense TaxID=170557 RepID=A0A7R9DPW4_TIMPO|nr:unnamed protein product [Timema poppensis]
MSSDRMKPRSNWTVTIQFSLRGNHYRFVHWQQCKVVIVQVCGGHGHSLALSAEGEVYSFGSSVFGQLGTGTNLKSCVPQQVILLPERICMIATGYFHNLAVSILNKLYIWGSSPQVLRLQAQAQKKVRLLQQQPPMMSSGPEKLQLSPTKNTPVTKGTLTNLRTDLSSPETNQNNATLQIKVNNRKFPSKTVRETRNDPMSRAINNSEVDFEVYDDVYSSNSSSRTPVYTDEDSKSFNVINNSNELSDSPKMENKLENSQLLFTLPDFKENTFLNPKNGTDSIRDPFLPNLLQKCIDNKLANRTFNSEDLENIYDPNTSAQEATKISLTQYPEANHQEISSCVLKNEKTDLINGTKMSLKTENKHLIHNESSLEELQTRSNISLQKDKDSNLILPYMCLTNSDPVNISNSSNLDSLNIHSNLFPKQVVPSATPYIAVSPSVEFKGLPVLPGSATSLAAQYGSEH